MKKLLLLVSIFFFLPTLVAAPDYPYQCSESENCDDSCDPGIVTCTLAATLPYPTYCDNEITPGKSVKCVVKRSSDKVVVASSSTSKCTGCDSGGFGNGCEIGSGAWWVGCDPFAY